MLASEKSKRLTAAVSALEKLTERDLEACEGIEAAHIAVKAAQLEDKELALRGEVEAWAQRLSAIVLRYFPRYIEVGVQNLTSDDEVLDWSDQQLRRVLESRVGHPLEAKSTTTSLENESFQEWATGHEKPHKEIVAWVAEVSAGGSFSLLSSPDGNPWSEDAETDAERAEQWQGPGWLRTRSMIVGVGVAQEKEKHQETLSGRLDSNATQLEIAMLQKALWEPIEGAFRHARLEATLALASKQIRVPGGTSRRPRLAKLSDREKAIRHAIRKGLEGVAFCRYLDTRRVEPLPGWVGWPGEWVTAYRTDDMEEANPRPEE